jgi:hypothetical protein
VKLLVDLFVRPLLKTAKTTMFDFIDEIKEWIMGHVLKGLAFLRGLAEEAVRAGHGPGEKGLCHNLSHNHTY